MSLYYLFVIDSLYAAWEKSHTRITLSMFTTVTEASLYQYGAFVLMPFVENIFSSIPMPRQSMAALSFQINFFFHLRV